MDENLKNDSQEAQPETNEQESETSSESNETEESPESQELANLRAELAKKDEKIAELARAKRELKQEVKKSDSENIKKTDEFDYAQLAYLKANGVADAEVDFVQKELKTFGGELKDLMGNEYFLSKLKTHRDAVAISDATPGNTRSSGDDPKSKAEYWIARNDFPPMTPETQKLRQEIINKKMDHHKNANQFSQNPIVR